MKRATSERCEVLVIGAGPAGATAALACAARGLRVILAEKSQFPRPKVCGCCLNKRALNVLEKIGIERHLLDAGGQALHHMSLHAGGRSAAIRLPGGLAVSRARLDFELATAAARWGADFREDCRVARLTPLEEAWQAVVEHRGQTHTIEAKTVLVAEGLAGRILDDSTLGRVRTRRDSRIGVGTVVPLGEHHLAPGVISMACGPGGYVGSVVLENGSLDVAAAIDGNASRRAGGPGPLVASIFQHADVDLGFDPVSLKYRGTPRLTRKRVRVADHRLFVLGDAAGYVEPFTGEGMAWAMTAGLKSASFAVESVDRWRPELIGQWEREIDRLVRKRQRWCRLLSFALRRPRVSKALVGTLAKTPGLSRPVVTSMNQPVEAESGHERIGSSCP